MVYAWVCICMWQCFSLSVCVEVIGSASFSTALYLFFIWSRSLHWIQSAPFCPTWLSSKPLVSASHHFPNTGITAMCWCVWFLKWVLMIWTQVFKLAQLVFYLLNHFSSPSILFCFSHVRAEMVHASQWNKPGHLRAVRHFTCLLYLSTKIKAERSEAGDGD